MKTRAIIKLAAFAHNLAIVRALAPESAVMAAVKADAYGHGLLGLLPTLQQQTQGLAIARIEEAQALRTAGYIGRLLLLCGVSSADELTTALQLQLDILVHDKSQLDLFSRHQASTNHHTTFWLKIDTGMHRLGFSPTEYPNAFQAIKQLPWCKAVIGMTHFASSDELDNTKTTQQIRCYEQHTAGLLLDDHSLANSGGIIAWPESRKGWVRPGLMMYGINPINDLGIDLQPVMQLEAQIIGIKTIAEGETTGYNERWCAKRQSIIAFVAAGYADGYPITALNKSFVAVNGKRAPVIGRVSMDTLAVDCTDINPPAVSDWVELWGNLIDIKEVANAAGSIPYELLTSVSQRAFRLYV
jgi:alanine racemase